MADYEIAKCESDINSVKITLANGVTILLASNPGYVHVHFSGERDPIMPFEKFANQLNIAYKPRNTSSSENEHDPHSQIRTQARVPD